MIRNEKGFTLIELMVVVLIIGILVAVAIPTFSGASANAKTKACKANLRTIDGAIAQYEAEYGGVPANGAIADDTHVLIAGVGTGSKFLQKRPIDPHDTITPSGYQITAGKALVVFACGTTYP